MIVGVDGEGVGQQQGRPLRKRPPTGRLPMTVKHILSRKGHDVLTIEPTATLAAAVG